MILSRTQTKTLYPQELKAELGDFDEEVTEAILKQGGLPCEMFDGRPDLPHSIAEEETIPGSPPMMAPVVAVAPVVGAAQSMQIDLDDSDVEVEYHGEIPSPTKGLMSPSVSLIY